MAEFDFIEELIEFSGLTWQEAERMYRIMNEPNTTTGEEEDTK